MYRYILLGILFLGNLTAFTQKKYLCEFSDTVITNFPDSVFAQMLTSSRPDIEIPPEVMQQYLSQVKEKPVSMIQKRIVKAEIEKTIISIERKSRSGNLSMETFDSVLYKNDELFPDSATASGFSVVPITTSRKDFLSTENTKVIMNYKCKEYISRDSTCRIWVTTELPDYLNPGIRKGNIKGAVLGFELKANVIITRSFLTRFGRSL
jgi:hypothetical protein